MMGEVDKNMEGNQVLVCVYKSSLNLSRGLTSKRKEDEIKILKGMCSQNLDYLSCSLTSD